MESSELLRYRSDRNRLRDPDLDPDDPDEGDVAVIFPVRLEGRYGHIIQFFSGSFLISLISFYAKRCVYYCRYTDEGVYGRTYIIHKCILIPGHE